MNINIVLFEPEIPQNTGNIMRSCVGFNAKLHLIEPFGFKLDDKHMKRASLDYLQHLDYKTYPNIEEFFKTNKGLFFYLTRYSDKSPDQLPINVDTKEDVYFIFGKESTGIPYDI
ncbi:MAG: TrmH family RNA methyltransferase, partial [Anaeroplasmataceae bacterium]